MASSCLALISRRAPPGKAAPRTELFLDVPAASSSRRAALRRSCAAAARSCRIPVAAPAAARNGKNSYGRPRSLARRTVWLLCNSGRDGGCSRQRQQTLDLWTKICCFIEDLAIIYFTFTVLRSADKFSNEQQILPPKYQRPSFFGCSDDIFEYLKFQLIFCDLTGLIFLLFSSKE